MIISISGTPGTGKTAAAKILAGRLGANLVSISGLLDEVRHEWDAERKTRIIDIAELRKTVNRHTAKGKINIVDGHLSHLLNADVVVILRCAPDAMMKRMKKKKWDRKKIAENIQAEILDEITIEAMEKHGKKNVFEIDTTHKNPAEVAEIAEKLLNKRDTKKYRVGRIDWTEKYKELLVRQSGGSRLQKRGKLTWHC